MIWSSCLWRLRLLDGNGFPRDRRYFFNLWWASLMSLLLNGKIRFGGIYFCLGLTEFKLMWKFVGIVA